MLREKMYKKIIQERETRVNPTRNRKIVKVLSVHDSSWPIFVSVFTEKVKVVEKRFYDIEALDDYKRLGGMSKANKIKKMCKYNDKIPILIIDYGKTTEAIVIGKENELVPVCCKKKDFDDIKIGDEITVYVFKSETYDGTMISLHLYNLWR